MLVSSFFLWQGGTDELKEHMDESVNLHLTQLMSKVRKNSDLLKVEWAPVRSLENAKAPELIQKIVELEAKVIVINIIHLPFSCLG